MNKRLIYDVGMYNGDDTAYYLSKGYSVVAIEANSLLVEHALRRFAEPIRKGKLTILNVGISDTVGEQTFWINEDYDEWSSFKKEIACRNKTKCRPIKVKCKRFRNIIKKYGIPYYIKCDIEESDIFCLLDLTRSTAPPYISVEAHKLEYLCIFYNLGYKKFKYIDQLNHNRPKTFNNESIANFERTKRELYWFIRSILRRSRLLRNIFKKRQIAVLEKNLEKSKRSKNFDISSWQFPMGSSGPFGEDTFGGWQTLEEVAYSWLHFWFGMKNRSALDPNTWYDFHAKKDNVQ